MAPPHRSTIGLRGILPALLCLTGGCGLGEPQGGASSLLTVDNILGRCGEAYLQTQTLQIRGLLRDYRRDERKVLPISWDYLRPDRCRLQINMDMALVVGENWWTYDQADGRFVSHDQRTSTMIKTSAYLLSEGIPFLLPDLLSRGKAAFQADDYRRKARWTLHGVTWFAERPCYVLARIGLGRDHGNRWMVWIDQDQFLVRGWVWEAMRPDRRQRTLMGCTYFEIVADQPIAPQRFQVVKPQPIVLPRPEAPAD